MRLHKDFINELKGRVASRMMLFLNEASSHSMLLTKISTLFPHIDSLEQELTELKQSDLMHIEDKRELRRKLESAAIYGSTVNRMGLTARNDLIVAEHRVRELELEKGLLLAQLEAAMLDHRPVVLPKLVAEALDKFKADKYTNYGILDCLRSNMNGFYTVTVREFALGNFDSLLKALANGYILETPEDLAVRCLSDMLEKWANGDYSDDVSVDVQHREFAKEIIDFVEGIKK